MSDSKLENQPSNDDVRQMREWLRKTPYVYQEYDDLFLTSFIRGCKGSLQKSKTVLENLNALGMRYPDQFGHMNIFDEKLQEHLSVIQLFAMPKRAEDGSLVIISRVHENNDPYKFHIYESQRYWLMSFYVAVWENHYGSGKTVIIYDWKNLSPMHFREVTPAFLRKSTEIMDESNIPARVQSVHFVNVPSFLEWMINIWKGGLKKNKTLSRIHIHSSVDTLQDHISVKLLPKEYGGKEEDISTLHSQWKKVIESYKDKLIAESNKMRSLDPIRPKTNDFQDMVGSFKVLNID